MSRQRKHKRRVYASIRRWNAVQWSDDKWRAMPGSWSARLESTRRDCFRNILIKRQVVYAHT